MTFKKATISRAEGGRVHARLFGTSRGKRMFFVLVLPRQNAMRRKGFMSDLAKKREELFQVFLMR